MKAHIKDLGPKQRGLRALIVEPARVDKSTPVMLFLHGKGEASIYINELPKVCLHLSPPFQAMCDRLQDVIVVAPQAPVDPKKEENWDWAPYLASIYQFLQNDFEGHKILATGFSRGGLGVLKFIKQFPECVSKWAIVDPQDHPGGAIEVGLTDQQLEAGWMRYCQAYPSIKNFGDEFRKNLGDPAYCPEMSHADLARAAYHEADALEGKHSLYAWLDVRFVQ